MQMVLMMQDYYSMERLDQLPLVIMVMMTLPLTQQLPEMIPSCVVCV
jgi:hypothetical protein